MVRSKASQKKEKEMRGRWVQWKGRWVQWRRGGEGLGGRAGKEKGEGGGRRQSGEVGINIFSPPAGPDGGEETELFAKAVAQTALVNMD